MKQIIKNIILNAARTAHKKGAIPSAEIPVPEIEEPKARTHGDFSTNIAMVMASMQKMAPRKIAEAVIAHLDDADGIIARTEIAGPGFLNFYMEKSAWYPVLQEIHDLNERYGFSDMGSGQKSRSNLSAPIPPAPFISGMGAGRRSATQ